ncbi:MAG: ribonuclease H-like domain-containing protein [Euryarchaeota archaeon]|nr:ribonuclease H-like domain-containing protein [Euryarchaeota archaeon]
MLERTFLHLPGIGDKRERRLWRSGVADWAAYRASHQVQGISAQAKRRHDRLIDETIEARRAGDLVRLAAAVPRNEHWRFYREPNVRVGFLDIETTGTAEWDAVTVVGVLDSQGPFTQLVKGDGLDQDSMTDLLGHFDVLVTFNGNGFDLPVLRRAFPGSVPALPHLDLRAPLARLGYKGGLKRIETELGLARPDAVQGLGGFEAVLLWRRWERSGDAEALEKLLAYNKEDVVNMRALADFACGALHDRLCGYWGGMPAGVPWPSGQAPELMPEALREIVSLRPTGQRTLDA